MNVSATGRAPAAAQIVTGMALGSIFLYSFSNSLISIMVNQVVEAFSLTGASEGLMSSMFSAGSMVALLATPLIQGRVGKLAMLLSATALQAVALAGCGLSPVFSMFCFSCVLLGMGGGLVDTYANSSLVDVWKGQSTKYLGYLHGLFGVGSLLAPLLVQWMLRRLPWQGVYYSLAGLLALGAVALLFLRRRADQGQAERTTREKVLSRTDLLEYIRNSRNAAVLLASAFATATQTGVLMWILRYMTLRFDAEALGALSISVYWICATINRFCASRIPLPPIRLFSVGALLTALFLAGGVLSGSPLVMCVAMGALGLSSGHFMQVLFSECAKGYEGKTTFVTSVLMVVMGIVRIVVPLIMAYVSTSLSIVTGMLLPAGAAVVAAASGLLVERLDARPSSNH